MLDGAAEKDQKKIEALERQVKRLQTQVEELKAANNFLREMRHYARAAHARLSTLYNVICEHAPEYKETYRKAIDTLSESVHGTQKKD